MQFGNEEALSFEILHSYVVQKSPLCPSPTTTLPSTYILHFIKVQRENFNKVVSNRKYYQNKLKSPNEKDAHTPFKTLVG